MTQHALTDAEIKQFKPAAKAYDKHDGHERGLILTVLPSGLKQFSIRYTIYGRKRRLSLGDFSTAPGGVTLAKAREKARAARVEVKNGRDPAGEQQQLRAVPTDNFAKLAEQYLTEWAAKKKRTSSMRFDTRTLNHDVLRYWGDRSVKSITRDDVKTLLKRITDRGAPIMANRCQALIHKMFNFAIVEKWIESNPATLITENPERARERWLHDEEIRMLWRCLENPPTTADRSARGRTRRTHNANGPISPVSVAAAAALQLQLLTLTRPGETINLEWADLDLDSASGAWWNLPAEKAKNGRAHRIPLCPLAVNIIRRFEANNATGFSTYVFASRAGLTSDDSVGNAASQLSRLLGFEFHAHDLRRTGSTLMAERAKVPSHVISRVLNHLIKGESKTTPIYNRYEYDDEKRAAIEAWARVLTAILDNKPFTKIVQFPTVAASA